MWTEKSVSAKASLPSSSRKEAAIALLVFHTILPPSPTVCSYILTWSMYYWHVYIFYLTQLNQSAASFCLSSIGTLPHILCGGRAVPLFSCACHLPLVLLSCCFPCSFTKHYGFSLKMQTHFQRSSDTQRLDYHWPVLGYSGRKLISRGSLSIVSSICSPKHSFPSCTWITLKSEFLRLSFRDFYIFPPVLSRISMKLPIQTCNSNEKPMPLVNGFSDGPLN